MSYPTVGSVRRFNNTYRDYISVCRWTPSDLLRTLDVVRSGIEAALSTNPGEAVTLTYDDDTVWFEVEVPEFWTEASVAAELEKKHLQGRREVLLSHQRSLAQAIGFKVFLGENHDDLLAALKKNKADLAKLEE